MKLEVEGQDLQTFRILISNELFEPTKYERPTGKGFRAFFEIPQQHLLSGDFKKIDWPFRAASESYTTRFKLNDITIKIVFIDYMYLVGGCILKFLFLRSQEPLYFLLQLHMYCEW